MWKEYEEWTPSEREIAKEICRLHENYKKYGERVFLSRVSNTSVKVIDFSPSEPEAQPTPNLDELTKSIIETVKPSYQNRNSLRKTKQVFRFSDSDRTCYSTSLSYHIAKTLSNINALHTLSKAEFNALIKRIERAL
ncbi:MAG: hypothetical protein SNJ55_07020 [Chloroherpetonaceae bacterium]